MDVDLATGFIWFVAFLFSTTVHEAMHALVAWKGGDPTAYHGGQVSLNPLPHIQREPFGTVLVPLLSFFLFSSAEGGRWMIGWASAPYDPFWEDRHPRRAAAMAAAGPAANLLLALVGFAALKMGLASSVWTMPERREFDLLVSAADASGSPWEALGRFCSVLFSLNLILCLFNLLPIPPMDGASVVAGLFEPARRLRDRLVQQPMFGMLGLIVAWQVFPYLLMPIYVAVLGWLYG